jgi:hypothetical protein
MSRTALELTEEEFKAYKRAAKLWKQRTDKVKLDELDE